MVSYECRKLDLTDAEMIMRMNRDFRKDFVTLDGIRNFLKKDENWMFAAVDGERIIGFVYGYELCRFDGKGTMLYLHEVGVMECFWRQGIGYGLFTELKNACKAKNICKIFLATSQNNVAANALYRKLNGEFSPESNGQDSCYYFPVMK